jgi:hypothetical protein
VPNRQQVEQGCRHREAGKSNEYDRDYGVPNEGYVAPQGCNHILSFHHGLSSIRANGKKRTRTTYVYPRRLAGPIISTLKIECNAAHPRMAAMRQYARRNGAL